MEDDGVIGEDDGVGFSTLDFFYIFYFFLFFLFFLSPAIVSRIVILHLCQLIPFALTN
jgi:hypothetical protein